MGTVLAAHAILLGIIEGLTEFLPVSSTAHLLLAGNALGVSQGAFLEAFSIAIQSGAILAAVIYFWKDIWTSRSLWWKVGLAFVPTAIAGVLLYPIIKPLFASYEVMAIALIVGGVALLFITPRDDGRTVASVSAREALLIGTMQIASFVPGVSRAGATLIGGSLARMSRSVIVPFSFLLAIPTIVGAGVVEARHVTGLSDSQWLLIALGGLVAFATALLTIRFFLSLLTKKPLSWLGWYRIALGAIVLIFIK